MAAEEVQTEEQVFGPPSLPEENPNDPFDRQRCIPGFRHESMENQVVSHLNR